MKNGVGDKSGERGENGSKITVVPKFVTKVKKKGSKLVHCFTLASNSNNSTFQERSAHRIPQTAQDIQVQSCTFAEQSHHTKIQQAIEFNRQCSIF